jgi:hypothetical protein
VITLNYLTHDRLRKNFHNLNFYFLNKIKDENKSKININILCSGDQSENEWVEWCKSKLHNIRFNVVYFPMPNNYLYKVHYISKNSEKYTVKWDEDYFINNHVWDYLLENKELLDDKTNLSLAPLSSTGIPTSELFINNFFDEATIDDLHKSILKAQFAEIWGYDYSDLNKHTLFTDKWDGDAFYNATNAIDYHYKGINPYRIDSDSQNLINEKLLNSINKFTDNQDYSTVKLNKYFCNHLNMMLTSEYHELLNDRSLYVDSFDEVPFNKYAVNNNKNFLFINNGFGIHIMYNTIWGHGNNFQKQIDFYNQLEHGCMNNEKNE